MQEQLKALPISDIYPNPFQPRIEFSDEDLAWALTIRKIVLKIVPLLLIFFRFSYILNADGACA